MAVVKFTNAYLSVNAVDFSNHVKALTLSSKQDTIEITAMSHTEHRFISGLRDWSIQATLWQDYAGGSIDATLDGLYGNDAIPLEVRPSAAAVSATNPKWTGNGVMEGYEPITGDVGTAQSFQVTFKPAGALTRATA